MMERRRNAAPVNNNTVRSATDVSGPHPSGHWDWFAHGGWGVESEREDEKLASGGRFGVIGAPGTTGFASGWDSATMMASQTGGSGTAGFAGWDSAATLASLTTGPG